MAHARGETVTMKDTFMPGTIVVRTNERRLYYFTGYGQAIRYPVGVGRAGKQWSGTLVHQRQIHPSRLVAAGGGAARPSRPAECDSRRFAAQSDGRRGHVALPVGEYAIHGTNQPGSIGHFVSYGCIRMYNEDISDLYSRVSVGTRVVVQ